MASTHHHGTLAVNQLCLRHPSDLLYHLVGYSQILSNGIKISVLDGGGGSAKFVPSMDNLTPSQKEWLLPTFAIAIFVRVFFYLISSLTG